MNTHDPSRRWRVVETLFEEKRGREDVGLNVTNFYNKLDLVSYYNLGTFYFSQFSFKKKNCAYVLCTCSILYKRKRAWIIHHAWNPYDTGVFRGFQFSKKVLEDFPEMIFGKNFPLYSTNQSTSRLQTHLEESSKSLILQVVETGDLSPTVFIQAKASLDCKKRNAGGRTSVKLAELLIC